MLIGAVIRIGIDLVLLASQSEACLDLLVRSFNQVFTPFIESSENRVHRSHRVDDLTRFYKQDENGNFVLRDDKWLEANPFVKSSKGRERFKPVGRSLFDRVNVDGRSVPDEVFEEEVAYVWPEYNDRDELSSNESTSTTNEWNGNNTNVSAPAENIPFGKAASNVDNDDDDDHKPNARKIQIVGQDYEYGDDYPAVDDDLFAYGHKPRYYVPGDRPLVDFLIKILEMFQVGLEATPNYIVPRVKDKMNKSKTKFKLRASNNESNFDDDLTE